MERILDDEGTRQEIHQGWKITMSYVLNESLKNYFDGIVEDMPDVDPFPSKRVAVYFLENLFRESHNDYHAMLEALGKKSKQSEYIESTLLGPKSPYRGILDQDFLKELNANIRSEARKELDSAARQAKR